MTPEEQAAADAAKKLQEDQAAVLAAEEAAKAAEAAKNPDADMIAKLVAEGVEKSLKDIKTKLDASYAARDAALKKSEALEQKEREAQLKLLDETGKHKEAFEIRLAEAHAKQETLAAEMKALRETNLELTRNVQIRDLLRAHEFRNGTAAEMGFNNVASQLVCNDKGEWVHRSGVSIKDFVTAFAASEENSFLFKAKESSGSDTGVLNKDTKIKPKSLFDRPQSEVLKMAAEGKLPARR